MMEKLPAFLFFLLFSIFYFNAADENYSESLLLAALPNGDIVSMFNFTTIFQQQNLTVDEKGFSGSVYIPWLFRHLFEQYDVEKFHLSMSQGFWRTNLWGNQHLGTETPSGTELFVEFTEKANNLPEKWFALVNIINGLFCTSILGMFPQYSAQPKLPIRREIIDHNFNNSYKWYGALGGESVCTENLKSWKKLLPCKQSGLVMLMEPTALLSARYHSITVKAQKMVNANGDLRWDFAFLAKTVHDAERLVSEYKVLTLESLFQRKLNRKCPVASQSKIIVVKSDALSTVSLAQQQTLPLPIIKNEKFIFDLNQWDEKNVLEIDFQLKLDFHQFAGSKSIGLHTFVESINQIEGRISTQIANPFSWPIVGAKFMQMIPWQLRTFLHTLNFVCFPTTTTILTKKINKVPFSKDNSAFTLALDGKRPLLIELLIELPANATCKMQIDYQAAFLKITDFPPDANSGISIPGTVLTIPLAENVHLMANLVQDGLLPFPIADPSDIVSMRVYGEPLLVLLPVPDFSMPFNVICLVCTAIAIYYGNVFALSTKLMKLVPKQENKSDGKEETQLEQKTASSFVGRIRIAIAGCWQNRICRLLPGNIRNRGKSEIDMKKQE